jgi:hypothetical protein
MVATNFFENEKFLTKKNCGQNLENRSNPGCCTPLKGTKNGKQPEWCEIVSEMQQAESPVQFHTEWGERALSQCLLNRIQSS